MSLPMAEAVLKGTENHSRRMIFEFALKWRPRDATDVVAAASRLERPARRNRDGDSRYVILLFTVADMHVCMCACKCVHTMCVLCLVHIFVFFQILTAAFTLSVYLVNI